MTRRDPEKLDAARAHLLDAPERDAPERESYLPTSELVALLQLRGDETVVGYGTGRLAKAVQFAIKGRRTPATTLEEA